MFISVKPNPVSNMKVYVINSTCLTLAWNTTESGPFYPKEHLIKVSGGGEDVKVFIKMVASIQNELG